MMRGLYTAASGMIAELERQDTVANNLANVNTSGYKRHATLHQDFERLMISRINATAPRIDSVRDLVHPNNEFAVLAPTPLGMLGTGSHVVDSWVDHAQGALRETGNSFDLALEGSGYFVLETPQGLAYTRNGAFTRNAQGELVTHAGYRVMGENGPLTLNGPDINISREGLVRSGNQAVGRLQIVDFADPQALRKAGDSLYLETDGTFVIPSQAQVRQGLLEAANVEVAQEMIQMISALRAYQINQKALQSQDDLMGRAVNDVGRPAA
jgi:flagellar basal-body rod protein FlgF